MGAAGGEEANEKKACALKAQCSVWMWERRGLTICATIEEMDLGVEKNLGISLTSLECVVCAFPNIEV